MKDMRIFELKMGTTADLGTTREVHVYVTW